MRTHGDTFSWFTWEIKQRTAIYSGITLHMEQHGTACPKEHYPMNFFLIIFFFFKIG